MAKRCSGELVLKLLERVTPCQLLLLAWLFRALLIVYGEWQDRTLAVKFTDVDYRVFTDAARHVLRGASPFLRPTYRYTPLLAWLLVPNHLFFLAFGKLIFVSVDVLAGWVMHRILSLQPLSEKTKMAACALWLFNPLTATVSSRGNAEALIALLVLLTIYWLMVGRVRMAAVCYGLSVHFKVYPVIYSLALLLSIASVGEGFRGWRWCPSTVGWMVRRPLSPPCVKFVVIGFFTFAITTGLGYSMYGWEFIQEAYLYHLTRQDIKHNFSPYFYLLYLTRGHSLAPLVGLAAFLPQLVLILTSSFSLHRDIPFCCFILTYIFVTFNKVCTSQYFLWYLSLLPVVAPHLRVSVKEAVVMASLWFGGQVLWLLPAYLLEFQGMNTFLFIWLASLLFFLINVGIMITLIRRHRHTHSTLQVTKKD